jgi:lipoprotein NlpI
MRVATLLLCLGALLGPTWAAAQGAPARKPAAKPAAARPAAAASAPAAARAEAPPAGPSGKGWRSAPLPAWVVEPPAPPPGLALAPNAGGRREQLYDVQSNYALPQPQTTIRWRSVALDAAALGNVSQPQIQFNPAFQTVLVHSVALFREGRRVERLNEARIELMRREQRLEQLVLDGTETLLVVLSDVRVGEPVEVAYTVIGENPIFEGRIATGLRLAYQSPVDLVHFRLTAPAGRELQVRMLASDLQPERLTEGERQVIRIARHQVPALAMEQQVPPWFKAYPALHVSEYKSWAEVDAWAQRLFAQPSPMAPAVVERAAAFKATGLTGAALVSEVLRFVQDEVRYFSVSLGESSHRPKPPQQTLADLLGDCKDKVQLLNALLRELGFDAKPALVSTVRNRGLAEFLPGHDEFDHVVTQLQLDGRSWLLDATINGQGLVLASRGQWAYGSALVVGGGGELVAAPERPDALNRIDHEQVWDLSQPGQPVQLTALMRAHGQAAERWRAMVASAGLERMAEALAGAYTRISPGLVAQGLPRLEDDREANVLSIRLRFTQADFGQYNRGIIEGEFGAIELLDGLVGPQEARRRMPFMLDQPRLLESRIVVDGALPVTFKPPAPVEVIDRHFRFSSRVEIAGSRVTFVRQVERRADQVLPADVERFRENLLKARGSLTARLRLSLFNGPALLPELERMERSLRSRRGWVNDTLGGLLARNEFGRAIDGEVLRRVEAPGPLRAQVLASRAQANNLLGDFEAGLADAEAALVMQAQLPAAQEARGVALFGLGRTEAALGEFEGLAQSSGAAAALSWAGALSLHLGRAAEAEKQLREAVDKAGAEEREFALLWLYLAAERQGGRGRAAIEPYLESSDAAKLSGALLRFLAGTLDRDALLKQAREKAEMERLNLAEAYFFIGQRHDAQGQRDEALRWYERTVQTGAVPYRELTFARAELQRGKAAR